MITLTKEWLLKTIAELEEERDAVPGVVNEDAAMALAAMKMALGALEAEESVPEELEETRCDGIRKCIAALRYHHKRAKTCSNGYTGSTLEDDTLKSINLLKSTNTAPALVSVPDGYRLQPISEYDAMCAAMLHGAEPISNRDELSLDYLQGLKDGLEWAAQLAEANHPHTGDWLYDDPLELAKAIRKGPDMPTESVQGWIPCSELMPEESGRYWCYVEEQNDLGKSHYQWNCSWNGDRWWVESENGGRVTHWMPLPSPPEK